MWLIGDGPRIGGRMSKEQIDWQRKVIREEYLDNSNEYKSNAISKNKKLGIKKLLSAGTPSNKH
jgi:hypothetical protein